MNAAHTVAAIEQSKNSFLRKCFQNKKMRILVINKIYNQLQERKIVR